MQNEDDFEIDLRKYIEVVIKRKKIVMGVVIVSMFSVATWSFFLPRIYEISMIIEPPTSAITDTGVQSWDTVANIKAKIEAGAYNDEIIGEMKLPEDLPRFDVALIQDTRMIRISLKRAANQQDFGEKILTKLLEKISISYAKIIEDKRSTIDNRIKMVESQIRTKENEIKMKGEQSNILGARELQYVEDIKGLRTNSDKFLANREPALEHKEDKDSVAALVYAATMQNLTQLQNDLAELKNKKEGLINEVESLKNGISESRIEIANLNMLKGDVQNIQVIQKPRRSSNPVGPKKRQNTLLAGFAGLVIGLCAVFIIEYWKNPHAVG